MPRESRTATHGQQTGTSGEQFRHVIRFYLQAMR